jgi:hypothetical protein
MGLTLLGRGKSKARIKVTQEVQEVKTNLTGNKGYNDEKDPARLEGRAGSCAAGKALEGFPANTRVQ